MTTHKDQRERHTKRERARGDGYGGGKGLTEREWMVKAGRQGRCGYVRDGGSLAMPTPLAPFTRHTVLLSSQLKARTRKHPGLKLCWDRRPSFCGSSEALFRLETCRVSASLGTWIY